MFGFKPLQTISTPEKNPFYSGNNAKTKTIPSNCAALMMTPPPTNPNSKLMKMPIPIFQNTKVTVENVTKNAQSHIQSSSFEDNPFIEIEKTSVVTTFKRESIITNPDKQIQSKMSSPYMDDIEREFSASMSPMPQMSMQAQAQAHAQAQMSSSMLHYPSEAHMIQEAPIMEQTASKAESPEPCHQVLPGYMKCEGWEFDAQSFVNAYQQQVAISNQRIKAIIDSLYDSLDKLVETVSKCIYEKQLSEMSDMESQLKSLGELFQETEGIQEDIQSLVQGMKSTYASANHAD